ncbi:hypothetical protein HDZ31DRAFT_61487 [Schizophyllum fasciatum]
MSVGKRVAFASLPDTPPCPTLSPQPLPSLREFHIFVDDVVPPHVNLTDKQVAHRYKQALPTYLLGYLTTPTAIYERHKKCGNAEATVEATLNKYLAFIEKHVGLKWGQGLKKEFVRGKEWWMFYAAQSLLKADILAIDQEVRDGFRRVMGVNDDPILIIYHHPRYYSS